MDEWKGHLIHAHETFEDLLKKSNTVACRSSSLENKSVSIIFETGFFYVTKFVWHYFILKPQQYRAIRKGILIFEPVLKQFV
jgi:hypothetical protein